MNTTISSLIYSTILAPSPFFVNKYYSFNECHLQKFSSILFYNQRILHLRKSIFSNGLNSIVYNNNVLETDEENKLKNLFKENRSGEEGHFEQVNGEYSISIIECTFNSIQNMLPYISKEEVFQFTLLNAIFIKVIHIMVLVQLI